MKRLTVIILSQNDEDVLKEAIESAKGFADEILVIDSNKGEDSLRLAVKAGAKVIKHPFRDFADQRNFGLDRSTTDWVLYLDSDEHLTPEFKAEADMVMQKYNNESGIGGYYINRKTFYYGIDWNFADKVQRLFYRKRLKGWRGVVHETPEILGEYREIHSPILHYTHRNLSQMIRKTNDWSEYEAKLRFDKNHPPIAAWRFFRVMTTEFAKSYIKNRGYRNGTYGIIEAMYQAFSIFITYAKLWELQEGNKGKTTS